MKHKEIKTTNSKKKIRGRIRIDHLRHLVNIEDIFI